MHFWLVILDDRSAENRNKQQADKDREPEIRIKAQHPVECIGAAATPCVAVGLMHNRCHQEAGKYEKAHHRITVDDWHRNQMSQHHFERE